MLRLLLTPRWLLRLALAVAVAGVFVWLGLWQWERAGSVTGRVTNRAYAVEWWIFAGFVFFCLWHWLRDEQEQAAGGPAEAPPPPEPEPLPHRQRAAPAPPAAADDEEDAELAAYNAYLAQLNARARERQHS